MNVRFHPPKDQTQYAELVLQLMLQSAIPQIKTQMGAPHEKESGESRSA